MAGRTARDTVGISMHTTIVNPRNTLQPGLWHGRFDTHRDRRAVSKARAPQPGGQ